MLRKCNTMEITDYDRTRIRLDIKISIFFSSMIFGGILVLLLAAFVALYFFTNPTSGFFNRVLYIQSLLIALYFIFQWNNLLKYIDLKKGKKIRFETDSYKIKMNNNSTILLTENPNMKFRIDDNIVPLIDQNKMLSLEFTKNSKTLLFLSNDNINLLDEIER